MNPVKEVPSDHDFFDPAYVKRWTESIGRYRPERKRLFEVFAAEAKRIKKGAFYRETVLPLAPFASLREKSFWSERPGVGLVITHLRCNRNTRGVKLFAQ